MVNFLSKDIYSTKWITAKITTNANRAYFVPIKHEIGGYFLAEIEKQIYCFKLVGKRVQVYEHTLVKSFRIVDYDISHYMPISASDNKALEDCLRINSLPKMNLMLFNILKLLGRQESQTEEFTPHVLENLVKKITEKEKDYKTQVVNIKNYLSHLNIKEIVTPVRKISEFIEEDLLETDAAFMGSVATQFLKVNEEHRKITNSPEKGKVAWIKIVLILMVVGVIAGVAYWAYDSGVFNNLLPSLPTFGGLANSPSGIMDQYPTPEALKAAIDRGDVNYNDLPPDIKTMVDQVETPTVEP